jgi:MinD superfamily P-loop ATPase
MPLIVLSGQPCSGKSTVAAKLQQLLQPSHPVCIVDEPSLHLERNTAYQSEVIPMLYVVICSVCQLTQLRTATACCPLHAAAAAAAAAAIADTFSSHQTAITLVSNRQHSTSLLS